MALWRRRCRRGCRNGKTVPLMLHPSHCLVHRSPNLPTAKERERKNYKGQAAEQAMVISSTWTRDDAQWFQMAETRQKRFTYSDFTKFSQQITANLLDFRVRSLYPLQVQNLSNCCRYKDNFTNLVNFIFWRVFAIWPICSAGQAKSSQNWPAARTGPCAPTRACRRRHGGYAIIRNMQRCCQLACLDDYDDDN